MIPVAEIEVMDRCALVALWTDVFGGPPPKGLSRPALRRLVAFEVQAQALGGLPMGFAVRLERAAADHAPTRRPERQAGGRLLREWNGVTHVVDVTTQGYRWRDRTWRSLSAIAREITGAHWSGPRFFGLTGRPRP